MCVMALEKYIDIDLDIMIYHDGEVQNLYSNFFVIPSPHLRDVLMASSDTAAGKVCPRR